MVRQVAKILKEKSPMNVFEFVINPRSFAQTIENIFYLSFSIRDARAKIDLDENGVPTVWWIESLSDEEQMMENKQCVLEMTMKLYEVTFLII
jgi:non-structural maintenance of chromosomes element 4